MYLVLTLVVTVGILSGPILSDDKESDILVPETKTYRKKNPENNHGNVPGVGRSFVSILKKFSAIVFNFFKQVSEPADRLKGEVDNAKSVVKGKKSTSDNVESGLVGLVKDARSVIFKVIPSLTGPADQMDKSLQTEQHYVSDHVGNEEVTAKPDHSDSNSLFYKDTTTTHTKLKLGNIGYPMNNDESTTEKQENRVNYGQMGVKDIKSVTYKYQVKPTFIRHFQKHDKIWTTVSKTNEDLKRSLTTNKYNQLSHKNNQCALIGSEYNTSYEKAPSKYMTHSEEFKTIWIPRIKMNREVKAKIESMKYPPSSFIMNDTYIMTNYTDLEVQLTKRHKLIGRLAGSQDYGKKKQVFFKSRRRRLLGGNIKSNHFHSRTLNPMLGLGSRYQQHSTPSLREILNENPSFGQTKGESRTDFDQLVKSWSTQISRFSGLVLTETPSTTFFTNNNKPKIKKPGPRRKSRKLKLRESTRSANILYRSAKGKSRDKSHSYSSKTREKRFKENIADRVGLDQHFKITASKSVQSVVLTPKPATAETRFDNAWEELQASDRKGRGKREIGF